MGLVFTHRLEFLSCKKSYMLRGGVKACVRGIYSSGMEAGVHVLEEINDFNGHSAPGYLYT